MLKRLDVTNVYDIEPHINPSPAADDAMQEEVISLAPGEVIAGQFEVLTKLGSGGMSSVYRCFDMFVERIVAVKLLYANQSANPKALNRFRREARAIAKMDHPNIVRLHSFNFDLSTPYIVMENVDGITLAELIRSSGSLPVDRVLLLAEQLCGGLQYAHEHGIIHRDLKPSNIIIERFDSTGVQAKILDFGIAKMLDDTTPGATTTGELFGTPAYMSPEQALGKAVDRRSDQYSLGCVLFECLTGTPPFVGSGQLSILMQHVQSDAPTLEECTFDGRLFPPQVQPVLDKMLAKFPEERYDSMSEVYANLVDTTTESDYAVETFSSLIGKAEQGLRTTQPNLPVTVSSTLPFWTGLAVGFSGLFVILAAGTAIYFFVTAKTPPPVDVSRAHDVMTEQPLIGIDVGKVIATSLQHQIRTDRQRIELTVDDKSVTDDGLAALRGAHSIEQLRLTYCENVTDRGLEYAWHLPLQILDLKGTSVTDNACKGISSHFPNLTDLTVQETAITDQGINNLIPLKKLSLLNLKMTGIRKPCVYLSKLTGLHSLLVDGCKVDLNDLHNPELISISASTAKVSDETISALLRHRKLNVISLNETTINDNQLQRLASLKSLRYLSIQNCWNVTAAGIKRFRRTNPNCKVQNIEAVEVRKQQFFES